MDDGRCFVTFVGRRSDDVIKFICFKNAASQQNI